MRTRTIDLLVLVVLVLDGGKEKGRVVREYKAILFEILIPSQKNRVKHRFVEKKIAHPFRYYDIELSDGQGCFFKFSLDEGDGYRA